MNLILPLIFLMTIIVCALLVFSIIVSKFPQLVQLNVTNLPLEKEARKKRELVTRRIELQSREVKAWWDERLTPFKKRWRKVQFFFRVYVGKVERLFFHEQMLRVKTEASQYTGKEKIEKFNTFVAEGHAALQAENYEQAERQFIAAITLNKNGAAAYQGLADTYLAKGAVEEAKETYLFLLHLEPYNDVAMLRVGDIAESQGNYEEAIEYYQQAVIINDSLSPRLYHLAELLVKIKQPEIGKEAILSALQLESKNPKYLDLLIEIAILCGDKALALKGYNDLRLVNPENQKLEVLKSRIDQL